jgi:predicted ATPase/class 3 adenylate cyclase
MVDLPFGTVTFLFTNIEGSTRLWEEHPEAMPGAYARHDAILKEAVARNGGILFKTVGDAFQTVFPTACQAIRAALESQLALQAELWPLPEPLKVRMALHTGAVEPDARRDYRSPVLNRLGRLLGVGHGSQVLASRATIEQLQGCLPDGASIVDLGARRLKDLGLPERIYQLAATGMPQDFPPLRTLDARPHNLPTEISRFIGREEDLNRVRDLFAWPGVRLVTLTGPGGIGKTRLALQAGAEMLERFGDGVYLVRLETITDPALVLPAIARVLGLEEQPEVDDATTLVEYLQDKEMLLILDNLEQVAGSASQIADVMARCHGLKVLATSRGRLHIRGEQEYPLEPLALPDLAVEQSLETLSRFDSLHLFVDRAQAVKPSFRLTDANVHTVGEICLRLDGIPLAIELAAARIRMLPPEAMLRRLSSRLPLLTGGARNLPERQKTLRQTIEWSYALLDAPGKALFRRLSVFAGGATLEAIESVAVDAREGWDTMALLERLVDQSLLRQTEPEGKPRFSMFETIREFGVDQLAVEGESDEANQRHAAYFSRYPALIYGSSADEAIRQVDLIEIEHDNFRVAREWTLRYAPELAYVLLDTKGVAWNWRVPTREEVQWARQVIAADPPGLEPGLRARCCMICAYFGFWFPGDPDGLAESLRMAKEAVGIFRAMDEPLYVIRALQICGDLEVSMGRLEDSRVYRQEAVEVARNVGDPVRLSQSLINLGEFFDYTGDLRRARGLLEEGCEIARTIPDRPDVLVGGLDSIGYLGLEEGNLLAAERDMCEAMAIGMRDRQSRKRISLLVGFANIAARAGRWERAVWFGGAIRTMRSSQEVPIVAELQPYLAEHDDHMAAATEHLTDVDVARLMGEGAVATLDEILDYVTEGLGAGPLTGMDQPNYAKSEPEAPMIAR